MDLTRRWVAKNFTVWRTHTRTLIIVSHALAHRTSFFDNRTRTFYYPNMLFQIYFHSIVYRKSEKVLKYVVQTGMQSLITKSPFLFHFRPFKTYFSSTVLSS